MGARFPLLDRAWDEAVFRREAGPITAATYLAHVRAVAASLPGGGYVGIVCRDRYLFAVAFAAGLVAGRTALLNIEASRLDDYPGCIVLGDAAVAAAMETAVAVVNDMPWIDAMHLAAIVFTSGSTGAPVPHEKRWGALVERSRATIAPFKLAGGSVIGTVPPQHMYGLETTILLPLHAPVCSWCGPAFFPGDVVAALSDCAAPRLLVTTPLQMRGLVQGGALAVESVVSATAPLDVGLAAEVEAAWSCPVFEIFGATECGSIASRRTTADREWVAYPTVSIGFEELGAIVFAPFIAPVVLSDVLEPAEAGFRLLGRRADVVKLGGRRASLGGLNDALLRVEGVVDGAFVVPDDLDERSTARLVAVVVAPGRTVKAIQSALRLVLDPVFLPRRVIRVERLPRNEMGKLPREALLALVDAARAEAAA